MEDGRGDDGEEERRRQERGQEVDGLERMGALFSRPLLDDGDCDIGVSVGLRDYEGILMSGTNAGFRNQELSGARWRKAVADVLTQQEQNLEALWAQTKSHEQEFLDTHKALMQEAKRLDSAFELRDRGFWGRFAWLVLGR